MKIKIVSEGHCTPGPPLSGEEIGYGRKGKGREDSRNMYAGPHSEILNPPLITVNDGWEGRGGKLVSAPGGPES
jgi:hypothetical protein